MELTKNVILRSVPEGRVSKDARPSVPAAADRSQLAAAPFAWSFSAAWIKPFTGVGMS